jgi:hypothetical protein
VCEDIDCGEGYMCVIEDPCDNEDSPAGVECEARAACVPEPELETDPMEPEEEEEEDTEIMSECYGDWDCEDGERCVFPADGLEEETNCGSYVSGTCVSTLF